MIDLHGLGIYEIDILDGKRIFNKRILLLQFPAQTLIDLHGLLNYEMIIFKKKPKKKTPYFWFTENSENSSIAIPSGNFY